MNIGQALKSTSKGRLHYDIKTETLTERQNWINSLNPAPCISKLHYDKCNLILNQKNKEDKENVSNNNNGKDSLYFTCYGGLSPPPKPVQSTRPPIVTQPKPVTPIRAASPKPVVVELCVSPEYGSTTKSITEYELEWNNKAQVAIAKKRKEFDDNSMKLTKLVEEQLVIREKQRDDKLQQLDQQTEKHLKDKLESEKQVQVIKETHRHHSQMLDAKVLEVEKKKQQLKDEEKKRQEQLKEIQIKIHNSINIVVDQFTQLYTGCQYQQFYSPVAIEINNTIQSLKSKSDAMKSSNQAAVPSQSDVKVLMDIFEECKKQLELIKLHIVEAINIGRENDKLIAAEQAKVQPVPQQLPQAPEVVETTTTTKLQSPEDVLVDALEEYTNLQNQLDKVVESLKSFTENPQMKKYKFELQKAVNTPINAISPESSSHLNDKLLRLSNLLAGNSVEISGKKVSAKDAPDGITFCKNLVAKMIVKKGAEQVSSKHDSAFAIASVAVGLWSICPSIGDILLAHFHSVCPYTVPITLPAQPNQTTEEYHKQLGYKVEDGVIEDQDKFLKRMSGIMRLYAAILVTQPPRITNLTHPYGLEHAWIWLSRILNTDPHPDITATMIHDMLYVTGHSLFEQYRNQFLKLLTCLFRNYVPKLKTVAVGGGPVSRLETYIDNVIKSGGRMAKPEGMLPPNFI